MSGLGMVLVTAAKDKDKVMSRSGGPAIHLVGEIESGRGEVVFE